MFAEQLGPSDLLYPPYCWWVLAFIVIVVIWAKQQP